MKNMDIDNLEHKFWRIINDEELELINMGFYEQAVVFLVGFSVILIAMYIAIIDMNVVELLVGTTSVDKVFFGILFGGAFSIIIIPLMGLWVQLIMDVGD